MGGTHSAKATPFPSEESASGRQAFLKQAERTQRRILYRCPTEAEWKCGERAGSAEQLPADRGRNSSALFAADDGLYNVGEDATRPQIRSPMTLGASRYRAGKSPNGSRIVDAVLREEPMADQGPNSSEGGGEVRGGTFHDDGPG